MIAVPTGFRESASGLVLPEAVSRTRRTLTWPEWRTLEAATKILDSDRLHADYVLRCRNADCPDRKFERVKGGNGVILRCGCTDRVFERSL